jgi:hypothetical protein
MRRIPTIIWGFSAFCLVTSVALLIAGAFKGPPPPDCIADYVRVRGINGEVCIRGYMP